MLGRGDSRRAEEETPVTDEELGREILPDAAPEERARVVARMTPSHRATMERLASRGRHPQPERRSR
jgi:ArsR family metal-binding transcriptional regulator